MALTILPNLHHSSGLYQFQMPEAEAVGLLKSLNP